MGGGGDVVGIGLLAFFEGGKDLVFALGDIELIEPADEFSGLVIVFCDKGRAVQQVQETVGGENVGGQQQLGEIIQGAEALVKNGHCLAIGHDEDGKLVSNAKVVVNDGIESYSIEGGHLRTNAFVGLFHHERDADIGRLKFEHWINETVAGQNLNCYKTVEPSIGTFLADLTEAITGDFVFEAHPFAIKGHVVDFALKKRAVGGLHRIVALIDRTVVLEAKGVHFAFDSREQRLAGFGGERFELRCVHGIR